MRLSSELRSPEENHGIPPQRWLASHLRQGRHGVVATGVILLGVVTAAGAGIDRHPELKSRPVAWTEYDGSYLVDTSNRAEMLDFFWTVFNRPYPDVGWTGSINPPVAGQTSELWRIREYAQLNAYRALNGSPPMAEDPAKLDYVQAGALVLAQNPTREISHVIDPTWIGYNSTAADALANSLIATLSQNTFSFSGSSDAFIFDNTISNAAWVGHRATLLHEASINGSVGATTDSNDDGAIAVWNSDIKISSAPAADFVAFPSPGYVPIGFFRGLANIRWSFVPANDWMLCRAYSDSGQFRVVDGLSYKDASVSATINGSPVPIHNLVRNNPPAPLTWDFDRTYLDLQGDRVADGTKVEITICNVAETPPASNTIIDYHDFRYTVTFFDEENVTAAKMSPQTPLVNLSTRSVIGTGDQQLIAGFSVAGNVPVRVALRTQGPGLIQYGIQYPARSTRLRVYDSEQHLLGENAGWRQHQDWRLLQSYGMNPSSDVEAGMVLTLWPGNYTAIVSDDTAANGIGIVEAFNIDGQTPSRLQNLSTRGLAGPGEQMLIAGFVIKGSPRTVVIRTQGPGLARYGVANVLDDPMLSVVDQADGRTIAANDNWRDSPQNDRLTSDFVGFAPTDPREAALVLKLNPGSYTALVSGKSAAGVAIVEVFDVGD
ncbi:MAG TPA: hypothetical protein VHE61_04500 [Opitutaceae bacterium]|nr:hypothetical protein [Opitutaceae bacterium]